MPDSSNVNIENATIADSDSHDLRKMVHAIMRETRQTDMRLHDVVGHMKRNDMPGAVTTLRSRVMRALSKPHLVHDEWLLIDHGEEYSRGVWILRRWPSYFARRTHNATPLDIGQLPASISPPMSDFVLLTSLQDMLDHKNASRLRLSEIVALMQKSGVQAPVTTLRNRILRALKFPRFMGDVWIQLERAGGAVWVARRVAW